MLVSVPAASMSEREVDSVVVGRAATAADLPGVVTCLARAFHEDPLWGQWSFPDEATRPRLLTRFVEFWMESALHPPWLRVADGCAAVAVWMPPGVKELTEEQERRLGSVLDDLFGYRAPELEALFAQFEAHHPEEPLHYSLGWWATDPRHAGRGIGTAVIREDLARIDAEHMPAYLENTNPRNLPRYEALGFRARSTFGPPGGPVVTTMWRDAR
jgi:ribosomal protein S18 acetylase RimI-like enzyme